jgi:hypothetical protein
MRLPRSRLRKEKCRLSYWIGIAQTKLDGGIEMSGIGNIDALIFEFLKILLKVGDCGIIQNFKPQQERQVLYRPDRFVECKTCADVVVSGIVYRIREADVKLGVVACGLISVVVIVVVTFSLVTFTHSLPRPVFCPKTQRTEIQNIKIKYFPCYRPD